MIEIVCPSCEARYQLPEGSIGPDGRKVSCSSCSHKWRAYAHEPEAPPEPEPEPEVAPASYKAAPPSHEPEPEVEWPTYEPEPEPEAAPSRFEQHDPRAKLASSEAQPEPEAVRYEPESAPELEPAAASARFDEDDPRARYASSQPESEPQAEPEPQPEPEPEPEPESARVEAEPRAKVIFAPPEPPEAPAPTPDPEPIAKVAAVAAAAVPIAKVAAESVAQAPGVPQQPAAGDRDEQMAAIRRMLSDLKEGADAIPEEEEPEQPRQAAVVQTQTMRVRGENPDDDRDQLKSKIDELTKVGRTTKGQVGESGYNAVKLRKMHEKRAKKLQRSRDRRKKSGAFITGFTLVALVTGTLVGLYVLKPQIIASSPEFAPALNQYTVTVDRYRVELNESSAEWREWLTARFENLTAEEPPAQ